MNASVKKLTVCAATCALLIAVQFALSALSGVELVTVLFLCFCYTQGVAMGCMTATAFSILRCLIFGFSPNALILYLVYFNLFALLFGWLGRKKIAVWVAPIIYLILASLCAYFAMVGVPVSILQQGKLTVLLWVLFALFCALFVLYLCLLFLKRGEQGREVACAVALSALCTVCFTLLDDVITPLYLRYSAEGAIAYFYASFTALLPQTVCCVLSVGFLFLPLKKTFSVATKWARN